MSSVFGDSGGSGMQNRANMPRGYPDPFLGYSTGLFPTTMEQVWRWSEQVWLKNGTMAQATRRVAAYFLTDPEVSGTQEHEGAGSSVEAKRMRDLLVQDLEIHAEGMRMGVEFLAYGNAFTSLTFPFIRWLTCDCCGYSSVVKEIPSVRIEHKGGKCGIGWKCAKCAAKAWTDVPQDIHLDEPSRSSIKFWPCREIEILHNRVTGRTAYFWKPPPEERSKLLGPAGDFLLQDYPWEMVKTVMAGHNQTFEFADGAIFHSRYTGLSGFETSGWGLPPTLNNFSRAYYVQLMQNYNEVIAHEYMMPFRVLSPPATSTAAEDPNAVSGRSTFTRQARRMLDQHRRNPGGYYTLPHAVEYQQIGGEGQNMMEFTQIGAGNDDLLTAMGVPIEFFKMSLTTQAAPVAIRLFQNAWSFLMMAHNNWLNWVANRLIEVYELPQCTAKWRPVIMADDLERKHLLANLMGAKVVSPQSALSLYNLDATEEVKKIMEFTKFQAQAQKELDEETASQAQMEGTLVQRAVDGAMAAQGPQQGGAPGGAPGQPPAPGGAPGGAAPAGAGQSAAQSMSANPTPQELQSTGSQEAKRLLGMDDASRRRELSNLRQGNKGLYAVVKSEMEQMRTQARSAGQAQGMQAVLGQGQK